MSVADRLTALAVAMSVLMPATAYAIDDFIVASSSAPSALKLCGDADDTPIKPSACKQAGYDRLVAGIDKAFDAALAKTPGHDQAAAQARPGVVQRNHSQRR